MLNAQEIGKPDVMQQKCTCEFTGVNFLSKYFNERFKENRLITYFGDTSPVDGWRTFGFTAFQEYFSRIKLMDKR